jgi:hypothetical protein
MVGVYGIRGKSAKSHVFHAYSEYFVGMSKSLRLVTSVSLLWNIYLVVGVINNSPYALTRAAGGQFETFPIGIRLAYVVTLMILLFQSLVLLRNNYVPRWVLNAFLVLGVLSVIVNAISRSSAERWNAIPAAVIAYAVFIRRKG